MGEKVISVRVPKEVADKVKKKAKREDLTTSQVVRRSLRRYLESEDCDEKEDDQ
jgi:predicted transcriptional regulator